MKVRGLAASAYGTPSYVREDDEHEFVLGAGTDLAGGCVLRAVPLQDQWQLANMRYRSGGGLIVTDFRGKEASHRLWSVEPTMDVPMRGVVLRPLHDGGSLFRGNRASAVEPLVLSNAQRAILAHVSGETAFDRVSVSAATGKGLQEVSRLVAHLQNLGFVEPHGAPAEYARGDEAVVRLKSERDRPQAVGPKTRYRRTARWQESFMPQWEAFLKSGEKAAEAGPDYAGPSPAKEVEADGGDGTETAVRGEVPDGQAELADADH